MEPPDLLRWRMCLTHLFSEIIERIIRELFINTIKFEGKDMEKPKDEFIGKTVLNAKGIIIGVIQKSMRDGLSKEITSVIVKPSKEVDVQKYTLTDCGEIIFPFSSLSSVKDIIIIEEPLK